MSIENKLKELNIVLPLPNPPGAVYQATEADFLRKIVEFYRRICRGDDSSPAGGQWPPLHYDNRKILRKYGAVAICNSPIFIR